MDEYSSSGMDPEVKRYFRQIMKSFAVGLLWMLLAITAGLFFKLAYIGNNIRWYTIIFYLFSSISLVAVILFLKKIWSNNPPEACANSS